MTIQKILNSTLSNEIKLKMISLLCTSQKFQEGGLLEELSFDKEKIINKVLNSNANFVQRLKDSNRKVLNNSDGSVSTHKLSCDYVLNENGNLICILYPKVQELNGELVDLSSDEQLAQEVALKNKDYIEFDSIEEAKWFTENYKKYIDSFELYNNNINLSEEDIAFNKFKETLPPNQRDTPEEDYHTKLAWQLNGKPKNFDEAIKLGMYHFDYKDQSWHGNSVAWGEDGIGYFLKPKHHDTLKYELDWYNNGLETKEGGKQVPLEGKARLEWLDFRNNYDLDTSGEDYKYIRKHKSGGFIKTLNPTETILIGNKEYDVEIADTLQKKIEGLSMVRDLEDDEGMLFIYDKPTTGFFTMKNTNIDLDIIFIDEDGEVIKIASIEANDPNPIHCSNYKYVLEVNIDSEIKIGDELDQETLIYTDDEKLTLSRNKMLVLDSNGDVQMKLEGGERIISMIKTRQLIKAALKAYKSDEDIDYIKVGRLILKELDALDSRDPLYVTKAEYGTKLISGIKSSINFKDNSDFSVSEIALEPKKSILSQSNKEIIKEDPNWNLNLDKDIFGNAIIKLKKILYNYDASKLDAKLQNLITLFEEEGIPIRITSGYREAGLAGNVGSNSNHVKGLAIDIVPLDNDFENLRKLLASNINIVRYMDQNNLGTLFEDTDKTMAKYGATGRNVHIGPDLAAILDWNNIKIKYPAIIENSHNNSATKEEWQKFRDNAINYFMSKGISKDAAMWRAAQLGAETGHGKNMAASHNYGNITKGNNWTGETTTKGNNSRQFRVYNSFEEGMLDYLNVLQNDYNIINEVGEDFINKLEHRTGSNLSWGTDPQLLRDVYKMYTS